MTQEQYNLLTRIFNTLGVINTKGEDTLNMAECLIALRNLLMEIKPVEE
jgi:hypothetical protein